MLPITSASSPSTLRRPVGEAVMQGRAGRGQPEQQQHDRCAEIAVRAAAMRNADDGEKGDGAHRRHAGRQHVPDEEIFDGECCVRRRRDAAGQRSRQALREIARRMAGEMAKKFAPQIARHADEGMACDPAGQTPQQIVGGDQRHQHREGEPDGAVGRVVQPTSVSTRNFTPYCELTEQPTAPITAVRIAACDNEPPAHIAQQEGNRPFRRSQLRRSIPLARNACRPTFVTPATADAAVTKKGPAACRPYFASRR